MISLNPHADPSGINPDRLPSVTLDCRGDLPGIPCIYFAIDSLGKTQYIGRTINAQRRWKRHHRSDQLEAMGDIKIAYLEVSDAALLPAIEDALITHFHPPLNGSSIPALAKEPYVRRVNRWTGVASSPVLPQRAKVIRSNASMEKHRKLTKSRIARYEPTEDEALEQWLKATGRTYQATAIVAMKEYMLRNPNN